MSSEEPRFTSHSVNITSSFIVYTQSSLWLHPCIVTEALIKLGIYEARILIIGDWAGWMMLFICRVLQLDESNLLSFKTPATCSDHKLAYFSQIIKKDKTKQKKHTSLQVIADSLRATSFLLLMVNAFAMLWNHSSSSLATSYPQICTQRLVVPKKEEASLDASMIWLVSWRDASFPLAQFWQERLTIAAPWPDRQPEWRVLVLCYLGPLGDFWQEMLVRQFLWSESSS